MQPADASGVPAGLGRQPWPAPEELDAAQRALYDTLAAGSWGTGPEAVPLLSEDGRLQGPFNAMLLSPGLGAAIQQVGLALRNSSALSGRIREACVLAVAVGHASEFEWFGHLSTARAEGLLDAEIRAIREQSGIPLTFSVDEARSLAVVLELVASGDLGDDSFLVASEELGIVIVQELIWLVGYYDMIALSLRVGRTPLPRGVRPVFTTSEEVTT